jgi:hypothetical protein
MLCVVVCRYCYGGGGADLLSPSHPTVGMLVFINLLYNDTSDKFSADVTRIIVNLEKGVACGVVNTGGKFTAGVNDASCKFVTGVNDAGGAPCIANIFANF